MNDTLIIAIWEYPEAVMTRPILVTKKTKELKLKGKKPNKMVVPESTDPKTLKKIKSLGSYKCLVVKAVGK